MNEQDRLQATLTARLPAFERKVARAEAIIAEALPLMPRPYVAFSGGVDSTVLLDLVLRQAPEIPVLFGDDGWDFPETLHFLAASEDRYWFRLIRVRSLDPWQDWCEELGRPDLAHSPDATEDGQPVWGNPHIWQHTWRSLTKDAGPKGGYGGVFVGLLGTDRKHGGESARRAAVLRNGTRHTYQLADGMWHCNPLAAWSKQDVWAYIVSRNLPYNAVYDRLAALDVPLERRRVGALTCFRVLQWGSHDRIKAGWPELFNRLAAIFPQVRAYA